MERKGRIIVFPGSFNPIHLGHIHVIEECLPLYEACVLYMRYNPGVDLTDWDTKKSWADRINMEHGGRVPLVRASNEAIRGKTYGSDIFVDMIRRAQANLENALGYRADAFFFGPEYEKWLPALQSAYPDLTFVFAKGRFSINHLPLNSTNVREDLEEHKHWLPTYIYEDLKRIHDVGSFPPCQGQGK